MMRRSSSNPSIITRVNVTPIIDVALVLVIILLVTAPMFTAADLPVDLPQAHTREAEDERNISITLGADGTLAVDQDVVRRDQLRARLSARLTERGNDGVLVVIRADSGARFRTVRGLLDDARGAGAKRLAIATRQKIEVAR